MNLSITIVWNEEEGKAELTSESLEALQDAYAEPTADGIMPITLLDFLQDAAVLCEIERVEALNSFFELAAANASE